MTDQETRNMLDAYLKVSRSQGIAEGLCSCIQLQDFNREGALKCLNEIVGLLNESREQLNELLMQNKKES